MKRRQQGASLGGAIVAILVAIGVAVQVVLIKLLMDYAYSPHGEARAFEGMALMAITFYAAAYVIPATFLSIGTAAYAVARQRREGRAMIACVFYIGASLLPFAVAYALSYEHPDTRRDNPNWLDRQVQSRTKPVLLGTNPAQKELSGRTFAVEANLFDDKRCAHSSPEFAYGCRDEVAQRGKKSGTRTSYAEARRAKESAIPAAPKVQESPAREPRIGERIAEMQVHRTPLTVLAFVGNGDTLASASRDGEVRFTKVSGAGVVQTRTARDRDPRYRPLDARLREAAFSPDGRAFAASDDGLIVAYDATTGAEAWRTETGSAVVALAFSHDGRLLAVGDVDMRASLRDARTGRLLHTLTGHQSRPNSVAFSRDGRTFMSADLDGDVILWDVASGAQQRRWSKPARGALALAALSGDGKSIVAGSGAEMRLLDPGSGAEVRPLSGDEKRLGSLAIAPDHSSVATFGSGDAIRLFDPGSGEKRGNLDYVPSVEVLAYSRDGQRLAAGDADGRIIVWQVPAR